jgi:hypothetical protein
MGSIFEKTHASKHKISPTLYNAIIDVVRKNEINFTIPPKIKAISTSSSSSTATRGIVIVSPTFQDPEAASGTTEYAGSGYYILRPDGQSYDEWVTDKDPAYTLNVKATDPFDNRVYIMTNTGGIANPAIAPHLNSTDWTISEEIKIEYANCQYNRTTETGRAIKDCWPVIPIGASVEYTSFTKQDTTVIYLLDETVTWVNTPELRNLIMLNGAGMAGYQ